eukprot:7381685-Prymnesium_polylepis.2
MGRRATSRAVREYHEATRWTREQTHQSLSSRPSEKPVCTGGDRPCTVRAPLLRVDLIDQEATVGD